MHSHHSDTPVLNALLSSSGVKERKYIRRIVITGCFINALMMCLKLTVGYYGHSEALYADGFHSLNDFAADLIMLLFIGVSFRKPDSRYSYGYGKYETFSTFLISVFLLFVAWHITHEAIESISSSLKGNLLPQPDIWTIVVVVAGMAMKEFLYRYYKRGSEKTGIKALLTNAWHHRSDAMASVATLTGVTFSHYLGDKWRILDPITSLILVVFIIVAAFKMLLPSFNELMDHSCSEADKERAKKAILESKGVKGIKELRSRKNGHFYVFDIEIYVKDSLNVKEAEVIAVQVKKNIEELFGSHILVSIQTLPFPEAISKE